MIPPELLEILKSAGAGAGPIFALLWWLERSNRIDLENELKVIAKDAVSSMVGLKVTVDNFANVFNPLHRRSK